MSISTIRRRLAKQDLRVKKVQDSEGLYRLLNLRYNVYCGGYDCFYSFEELEELAADDEEENQ